MILLSFSAGKTSEKARYQKGTESRKREGKYKGFKKKGKKREKPGKKGVKKEKVKKSKVFLKKVLTFVCGFGIIVKRREERGKRKAQTKPKKWLGNAGFRFQQDLEN